MKETIQLNYGKEQLSFSIEGAKSVTYIEPNVMPEITDLKQAFLTSITTGVIGGAPLKDRIAPTDPVTIVVSDITRSWMHQDRIVPLLVSYLHEEMHIPYAQIVIVIALGTHRKSTKEEMITIVSKEVYDKVTVVDHDCDAADLVLVGKTRRGTDVWVNKLVVDRKVIVLGGTVHHMMAGFGGGRKSILPGVAGRTTIRENHCRALDPHEAHSDARVGCCKLKDNPINEDMREAAKLVHVTFGINLCVSSSGVHSGIFSGDLDEAWLESCAFQSRCYEVEIPKQADIVLCSSGGYPKDMNLYQGCKGMLNAMRALKPGGEMIWACKCPEGGGSPAYFDWLVPLKEGRLDEALRENFTIDGYIFYLTCENLVYANCHVVTTLSPELVAPMRLDASENVEELVKKVDFTDKEVYVINYAGSVVPMCEKEA